MKLLLMLAAPAIAHSQAVVVYSHHDAQQAQRVRAMQALTEPTLMDRDIPPGANWRAVMGQALCNARLVLLVWSAKAAESQEVGAEWRIAAACGRRIVGVMLDDTKLPAEAATVQAVDWR